MKVKVYSVPQVGGGVRLVALADRDHQAVVRDSAMIDAVRALGIMDVIDGHRYVDVAGPRWAAVPLTVRDALRVAAADVGGGA